MKHPVRDILLFAMVCLLVNSCNDQSTSFQDHTAKNNTATPKKVSGSVTEFPVINRFDLDIEIDQSISSEQSGYVKVTAKSKFASEKTELVIIMPEIDAMEKAMQTYGNTNMVEIPVDQKLPSEREEISSLGTGQYLSKTMELAIQEPGYYSIYATIRLKSTENPETYLKEGKYIRNSTSKNLWLWVDEEGSKVTDEFKKDLFPKEYLVQPGPLTPRTEQSRLQYVYENTGPTQGQLTMSQDPNNIVITATYMDITTSTIKPLANAYGTYEIYDEYSQQAVAGGNLTTNSQGEVGIGCSSSQYYTYTVEFFSENADVVIYNDIASKVVGVTQGAYDNCGLSYGISTSQDRSHVYGVTRNIVTDAESFFSENRSKIGFSLDPNDGSFYSPSSDAITILHDPNGGDSHIGGSFGDFVVAHEYGHAFHEKALGGIENPGSCPRPHYVTGAYNLQCAFFEGFANYFAETFGFDYFNFESINRSLGCIDYNEQGFCLEWQQIPDGSVVEGAVASFLYDVTDPANESFDNLELPGSYVADIINTCKVSSSVWDRADGIDHLIACFENNIPNYSNYFPTRSSTPTMYQESVGEPSGWDDDEIRRLWLRNLYDENYSGKAITGITNK